MAVLAAAVVVAVIAALTAPPSDRSDVGSAGGATVDGGPYAPLDVVPALGVARRVESQARAAPDVASLQRALAKALRDRDADAASAVVERWFREVPEPVRAVLDGLAANPTDDDDIRAFGTLLAAAMTHARLGSAESAPWTPTTLARAALGCFPAGDGAARALRMGLEEAGSYLPGGLLGELLVMQGERVRNELSVGGQLACMDLASRWAASMGPDAEQALLDVYANDEADPFAQAQAARWLLQRDWRAFSELLVDVYEGRRTSGIVHPDEDALQYTMALLTTHAEGLTSDERIEFATRLFRDDVLGARAAYGLTAEEAAVLLADAEHDAPPAARRWLELRAGGERWLEAGVELIRGDTGDASLGWGSALATLLERGANGHAELNAALEAQFETRHASRGAFWNALAHAASRTTDEVALLETFAPWVERSAGERSAGRAQLVAILRERMPTRSFE